MKGERKLSPIGHQPDLAFDLISVFQMAGVNLIGNPVAHPAECRIFYFYSRVAGIGQPLYIHTVPAVHMKFAGCNAPCLDGLLQLFRYDYNLRYIHIQNSSGQSINSFFHLMSPKISLISTYSTIFPLDLKGLS